MSMWDVMMFRAFAWTPAQKEQEGTGEFNSNTEEPMVPWCRWEGETWRTLTPGRRSDVQEKSSRFMKNTNNYSMNTIAIWYIYMYTRLQVIYIYT